MLCVLFFVACSLPFSLLQIILSTENPCHEVDKDFLSVTMDTSAVQQNFSHFNLASHDLITLAQSLAPVMIRVGGTSADYLIFNDNLKEKPQLKRTDYVMIPEQFDALMNFADNAGWKMIFGLNLKLRFPNNQWDFSNAELLIDYCIKKGYQVAWELGNEPDCYSEDDATVILNGTQGAVAMKVLRELITKKGYPVTLLAGPDVAVLQRVNYFSEYLSAIQDTINAATWHHYYGAGDKTKLEDFYSVGVLDSFIDKVNDLLNISINAGFRGDLWIGETSSTYGGGTELFSSSYVAGFMWLDKLGVAAYSHKKIFRQTFIGNKYSLISDSGCPYPDYWSSLLHKTLVGTKVLNVSNGLDKGRGIRVYAYCAKPSQLYTSGSVVLMVVNLYNESLPVVLQTKELLTSTQDIYWLTPYPCTDITSRNVALNDRLLAIKGGIIPTLSPLVKPASDTISVQPLSYGFIVFKEANVIACM